MLSQDTWYEFRVLAVMQDLISEPSNIAGVSSTGTSAQLQGGVRALGGADADLGVGECDCSPCVLPVAPGLVLQPPWT